MEGKGYAVDLVIGGIANSTFDHSVIVVGLFKLQNLNDCNHSFSFGALGVG